MSDNAGFNGSPIGTWRTRCRTTVTAAPNGACLDGCPSQLDQLVQLRARTACQAAPPAGWLEHFRRPDVPHGTAADDRRIAGHVQHGLARAASGLRQKRRLPAESAGRTDGSTPPRLCVRRRTRLGSRQRRNPRSRHQQRRFCRFRRSSRWENRSGSSCARGFQCVQTRLYLPESGARMGNSTFGKITAAQAERELQWSEVLLLSWGELSIIVAWVWSSDSGGVLSIELQPPVVHFGPIAEPPRKAAAANGLAAPRCSPPKLISTQPTGPYWCVSPVYSHGFRFAVCHSSGESVCESHERIAILHPAPTR